MEVLFHVYLFVIGAIFGSFYNVVGLRIPAGQSIVTPRSNCPTCKRTLTWIELIPVVSYVVQRGHCKKCATYISIKYPVFELTTAILFTLSPVIVGWSMELAVALVFISLLIIITISDLETMLIPDKVLLFFLVPLILLRMLEPLPYWWDSLAGAAFGFLLFLLLAIVSKGGMGGGDIKLMAVIGLVLGFSGTLLTIFLSSFLGAVFGIIGLLSGKLKRKHPIPFGPFIALGAIISYFYYDPILDWYINVILHGGFL